MKSFTLISVVLMLAFFILTGMTTVTIKSTDPVTQMKFNDFFRKRSFVMSSIPELEMQYKTTFNFFQKIKINQAKRKFARQLNHAHLLEECDTIKLKNGEEVLAFVSEVNPGEIKYKRCDDKTGATYTVKRSDIAMIVYANGLKDYFGNKNPAGVNQEELVSSDLPRTDPMAVASIASLILGLVGILTLAPILTIFLPAGIILGFMSKKRIKKSKGKLKGRGLALAAIIGGFLAVALVLSVLTIIFMFYEGG